MLKKVNNKKAISNIRNEFEILMINDFLTIEKAYQNNINLRNLELETGQIKAQKNKCISRNLPISKININNLTNLQT